MDGMLRILRRCLLSGAALAAFALAASANTALASNPHTALLDAESVSNIDGLTNESGEPVSLEQFAAEKAGYKVTVASGAEWEAFSAEQFAQYQVLIVGDPDCRRTALSAVNSAKTWVPVVMTAGNVGNRVVVGTDPEFHYPAHPGAEHLVQDGITFAGGVAGATGIYFTTSCFDQPESEEEKKKHEEEGTVSRIGPHAYSQLPQPELEGEDGRDKSDVLEHLTEAPTPKAWTENELPPCGGSVQQIAFNPVFSEGESKLLDTDIQGWSCSDHITFPTFPADWLPLAVATDAQTHPTCGTDPETAAEVCGEAYVLIAGRGIVASAPNISLSPTGTSAPGGPTATHTVTAHVHKEGGPVVGAKVTFAVTGQNAGVVGTCTNNAGADPECVTDSEGNVNLTYADVRGVGSDTIIASVTLETVIAGVEGSSRTEFTTERATATHEWTPAPAVVTTTTPPPPAAAVLAAKAVSTGSAHLARTPACVASTGYVASVRGKGISSVTYTLDGHRLATVKHSSHGAFSLRVHISSGRAHHLSIRIAFTKASNTKAITLKRTIARCAAVKRPAPRFTG